MLFFLLLCSLAVLAKQTRVRFDLSHLQNNATGSFVVQVDDSWAPLGAARFLDLVDDKFFDGSGIFRCVPSFVVQFGLASNTALTAKWGKKSFKDDPVRVSNKQKTISFATAGPNTRTTQVFISLIDNERLDGMGFAPFGQIVDGWDTVSRINFEYREKPQQGLIQEQGGKYLADNFPRLTTVVRAVRV